MRSKDTQHLKEIFLAGVQNVQADRAIERWWEKHGQVFLEKKRLWIFGAGKASALMAQRLEGFLLDYCPEAYLGGVVVVKDGHALPLARGQVIEAAHPLADSRGEKAALQIMQQFRTMSEDDLVFFCLSGGASALLPAPVDGMTLEEKNGILRQMMNQGADIVALNTVRKHLSKIKGGHLQSLTRARIVTLAISDVPNDAPSLIGSGPTGADLTSQQDAHQILNRFGLASHFGKYLQETPKNLVGFGKDFHVIAAPHMAVTSAMEKATNLGYTAVSPTAFLDGDVSQVADHWDIFRKMYADQNPACVIVSAEPTVKVKGQGRGGRNTESALRLAVHWALGKPFAFLSAGTDGTDGPTDAAGAFCDETTLARAQAKGLNVREALANNDSYSLFHALGDLLVTGPTGTNVMDLQILLLSK